MDYLFKGILSPELPPVPSIGLGQSNKQRREELLAREVCIRARTFSSLAEQP